MRRALLRRTSHQISVRRAICVAHHSLLTSHASGLHAFLLLIRPFKLDRVTKHLLKAPRANVTDFSIGIVIPTRLRDRIGDCFTQLMRSGCGSCIEGFQTAKATAARWIRHYCVIHRPDVVMIAAVALARPTPSQDRDNPGVKINEIKRVRGVSHNRL